LEAAAYEGKTLKSRGTQTKCRTKDRANQADIQPGPKPVEIMSYAGQSNGDT